MRPTATLRIEKIAKLTPVISFRYKIRCLAWRAVSNNECSTCHSCPAPLPLHTARREQAVGSARPRNGADRLLHRQGGTTVDCVLVEGKVAQVLVSSLVSSPQRRNHRPKNKHRHDEEGRERRRVVSQRHKGPARMAWPVGPATLWEPC
jgi:hypothetical protein